MKNGGQFYIDGQWITPASELTLDVLNPATGAPIGKIALGDEDDVNNAVAAAKKAFDTY